MAYFYVGGDRDQLFLLPTSMRDWLDEDHLAWFVIDVVDHVETAAFHARHPNDGPGRPAYHPDMILALLFYAYGVGLRSSRRIEAACRTDAAFRVITGGVVPDHATIARFLVDHQAAIENVFVDVLRLCAAAGLTSVGMIAIDGTKMGTDAALDANRGRAAIEADLARIRREVATILTEAQAADVAEDTQAVLSGAVDRLPVPLATRRKRHARLTEALDIIDQADQAARTEAEQQAVKAAEAVAEGRQLKGRKPTKNPYVALARAELDMQATKARIEGARTQRAARRQATLAQAAADRRRPWPLPSESLHRREQQHLDQANQRLAAARQAVADATPTDRQANITDPDSQIMKTAAGWVQGYNAQAAVNEHQIVIAHMVSQDANDIGLYQPMVTATHATLTAAGISNPIGIVLADAGYWSDDNATADGPDRLIATQKDWKQRRAARDMGTTNGPPPADASVLEAMEHRLRTPQGAATYAQRSHTVEPVFGNGKENRGWRRFRRRGLTAARSEWALITTSHNIAKLFNHHAGPAPAPS